MSQRSLAKACLLLLALATPAGVAARQDAAPPGSPAPGEPGADWQPRTQNVVEALQKGEWATAEEGSRSLVHEMVAWIAGGGGAARSLALMTSFQAIAEAGLNRRDDALWHWQLAQQIAPEIGTMQLGSFGAAGAALVGQEPRLSCDAAADETAEIAKPKPLTRPGPEYPEALRRAGVHGAVTVEALVGADGIPRSPRVLTPGAPPTLILAAAESLRSSRFAPATRAGQPIPFCYSSTMRFELVEPPKR